MIYSYHPDFKISAKFKIFNGINTFFLYSDINWRAEMAIVLRMHQGDEAEQI